MVKLDDETVGKSKREDGTERERTQTLLFRILAVVIGLGLLSILVIVIEFWFTNESYGQSTNTTALAKLRIVTRCEWLAQPPVLPVGLVIISDSGTHECFTEVNCIRVVREIQLDDMQSLLDDMRFHFLVGGDGVIYEGRGWSVIRYADMNGDIHEAIVIALIGQFTNLSPTEIQFNALKLFLEEGVRSGRLTNDFHMYAWNVPYEYPDDPENPGDKLIEVIQYWPHYKGHYREVSN